MANGLRNHLCFDTFDLSFKGFFFLFSQLLLNVTWLRKETYHSILQILHFFDLKLFTRLFM